MTHAEYVAQGYEPIYQVSDVYEDMDMFVVDVLARKGRELKSEYGYGFGTLVEAEEKRAELEAKVADMEVEADQDDPEQEYKAQAMNELAERSKA